VRPRVRHRLTRHQLWEIGIGAAAGVVVVLLILVGSGILVRPSSTAPTVTVIEVQWTILQGETRGGFGWFGPSYVNVTSADGLPVTIGSGESLTMSIILANLDSANHTVSMVTAHPPFSVVRTTPALPSRVDSGEDDWDLAVTVVAPTVTSDTSYTLDLTIDATA
jgi:hypothetical protein